MDTSRSGSALLWAAGLGLGLPLAWALFGPSKRQAQKPKSNSFNAWLGEDALQAAAPPPPAARNTRSFGAWTRGKVDAEAPPVRDPAVFGSYIRKKTTDSAAASAAAKQEKAVEEVPLEAVRVPIFFGTEFGFSKEIAGLLADKLKDTGGFWPVVMDMGDHPDGYDFSKEQAVFMICSTQGDGVPPAEARGFCEWLPTGTVPKDLPFSVCALGDTGYEKFCACGKALDASLESIGGKRVAPRMDVNREDYRAVHEWIAAVAAALPALALMSMAATGWAGDAAAGGAPKPKRWGKSRPYAAKLEAIEGLCVLTSKDDKDTIRAQYDLGDSGITYLPGDALGVYPTNNATYVKELLDVLKADGNKQVDVPSFHYEDPSALAGGKISLSTALTKCYDLKSPKPELFKLLLSAGAKRKDKAAGITLGQLVDMSPDAANYLEDSHIVDIVRDFGPRGRKKDLPIADVLAAMRPLQPRLYSISSSPLENAGVQATCAVVRYNARNAERIGVCSTFMAERAPMGESVPVYIAPNPDFRLPESASTPIIMVGPGTGLSPFRAFIKHRLAEGQPKSGPIVLYFGCRRRDQDYLYGDMLEGLSKEGKITLHTAFSREGKEKVYVQDRLLETGKALWGLLEAGAHFYVCGDAKYMAPSVERALVSVVSTYQGEGLDAAKAYVHAMSAAGRYQKDVWA